MVSNTTFDPDDSAPLLTFVYLATFERAAKGLLTEADRTALERTLLADPQAGDVMHGTGGFRKIRFARAGGGKRGGLRVIYYYRAASGRLYLLTVYAKNVIESLTRAQQNELKTLAKKLDGE
jgi:hypothetical protein